MHAPCTPHSHTRDTCTPTTLPAPRAARAARPAAARPRPESGEIHATTPRTTVGSCASSEQWKTEGAPSGAATSRQPDDALYEALRAQEDSWADAGLKSVRLIGDANAPGPIAWATYAGHNYARNLEEPDRGDALPFRREVAQLASG